MFFYDFDQFTIFTTARIFGSSPSNTTTMNTVQLWTQVNVISGTTKI